MEASTAPPNATATNADAGAEQLVVPPPPPKRAQYNRAIVEGPLLPAVWHIAWPTMLQNMIGGLQGMIDHVMVGHAVGYAGNAAIGVSWQIFLVVVVFIASLFTGMSVLVARFAGANEPDKVDRTIYQAFITAVVLAVGILAPLGYLLAPTLLDLVNANAAVQHEALPYLRIMFVYSFGMLIFFMLGGALRSAGDARTPLRLGIVMTVLNIAFNSVFIFGLGPVPAYGTAGAAVGTVLAAGLVSTYAVYKLHSRTWVAGFPKDGPRRPHWPTIRALFRFGLPTGIQGIAMNVGGVLMLSFIGIAGGAAGQAAFAVSYGQLFSLITWTSVGLMGAAAAVAGQNLGAKSPERAIEAVHAAARIGLYVAIVVGVLFMTMPRTLLSVFGITDPAVADMGVSLLRVLSVSGLFITVALTYTGGLQGTGDTKSPLYISIVSQVIVPLGICFAVQQFGHLDPLDIWLAILAGHFTRCTLSLLRFRQGEWRKITVEV